MQIFLRDLHVALGPPQVFASASEASSTVSAANAPPLRTDSPHDDEVQELNKYTEISNYQDSESSEIPHGVSSDPYTIYMGSRAKRSPHIPCYP